MAVTDLMTRAVTIVREYESGEADDYGNMVPARTLVQTVGELQQRGRDEPGDQGEMSRTDWLLFLPAETVIDTADRVIVDGAGFEVVGDPWHVRNPRLAALSHVEATLRRTGPVSVPVLAWGSGVWNEGLWG